jgi:hypothetical protein
MSNDTLGSPKDTRPSPDPTIATNEAVARASKAQRDYIDGRFDVITARLDGMDEASKVLSDNVNRTPTDIQQGLGNLKSVLLEKFKSIALQFKERDVRSERESRDNKVAVDAAFAAQKEAASEQNKSNTLAISKSEASTVETINKLSELFKTTTDALYSKIDDVKDRIAAVEVRITSDESANHSRGMALNQVWGYILGIIGVVAAIITALAYTVKK